MPPRRPTPPSLPRLPVPDLSKTLQKYLASLEPLMLEDDRKGKESFSSAYAKRTKIINEFESGIGRVLQDRLIALDRESPNNWLDDNFWLNKAYLEWRAPLLVNSNWWLAFHDDDLIPESAKLGKAPQAASPTGITPWQVRRAAWLVYRTLDFKHQLDSQEIHPETTRTGIWFRRSTEKMFNIGRIPHPTCDTLSSPDPTSPDSQKLLLMIHNFCYLIPMYRTTNPSTNTPQLLSAAEIEEVISGAVRDVEQRLENGEKAFPVGTLSADDRDCWAKNLEHLLSLHPQNKQNYQALLNSVMALSLEHTTHTLPKTPRSKHQPQTIAQHNLDGHLQTIRSTEANYSNRFFDKPYTLIVDPATQAGATGEHSPCDALVPSIVAEYAIVQGVDDVYFKGEPALEKGRADCWERVDWVVDEHLKAECRAAHKRNINIIQNSDDSVLWFEGYGSDWIKGIAQLPPDAFIQMALQLAWYKTRKEFTATYETVLTRMFKHGRTETLRTLTRDSRAWVLAMTDSQSSARERVTKLKNAIAAHSRLTKEAATGRGIDRHLLGLRLMLKSDENESSSLFSDELFGRSQEWKLSTSGLSAGLLFRGTGFGAAYEDGYGINYLIAPAMVKFGIESKHSSSLTSTELFKQAIVESLYEMRMLCSDDSIAHIDLPSHL